MKIYDKDMYNKQEEMRNVIIVVVAFLVGFFVGYMANSFTSAKEENKIENDLNNVTASIHRTYDSLSQYKTSKKVDNNKKCKKDSL